MHFSKEQTIPKEAGGRPETEMLIVIPSVKEWDMNILERSYLYPGGYISIGILQIPGKAENRSETQRLSSSLNGSGMKCVMLSQNGLMAIPSAAGFDVEISICIEEPRRGRLCEPDNGMDGADSRKSRHTDAA